MKTIKNKMKKMVFAIYFYFITSELKSKMEDKMVKNSEKENGAKTPILSHKIPAKNEAGREKSPMII
jgi:hypothetical protein